MNTEDIKQIIETIKTMNININSVTGQKALEHVADKVGNYLIFQAVLNFAGQLLLIMLGLAFFILAYRLFTKLSKDEVSKNRQSQIRMAIEDLDSDQIKELKGLITELIN